MSPVQVVSAKAGAAKPIIVTAATILLAIASLTGRISLDVFMTRR
jgi:hypothetical protein